MVLEAKPIFRPPDVHGKKSVKIMRTRWGGGAHSSFHEFARKDFELFQMWFFGAYTAQADQKI